MRGRLIAGIVLLLFLLLAVFVYRGCRLGGEPRSEAAPQPAVAAPVAALEGPAASLRRIARG